jgi:uncharacterized protein (DUF427 family)
MARAIWKGQVIAESSETVVVEGNHYFPRNSVRAEFLTDSDHHTFCGWKGQASYYHLRVNGDTNHNAAWTYPDPKPAAGHITDYIAFWKGVTVEP